MKRLGFPTPVWVPNYFPPHHYRKYTVRLGEHSLQKEDRTEQERAVAQSIPHPCYDSNSDDHKHDLMLIRLRGPASLGPQVKPINLTDHCPQVGQKCTISGWGTVTSPQGIRRERRRCRPSGPQAIGKTLPLKGDKEGKATARLGFTSGPG